MRKKIQEELEDSIKWTMCLRTSLVCLDQGSSPHGAPTARARGLMCMRTSLAHPNQGSSPLEAIVREREESTLLDRTLLDRTLLDRKLPSALDHSRSTLGEVLDYSSPSALDYCWSTQDQRRSNPLSKGAGAFVPISQT